MVDLLKDSLVPLICFKHGESLELLSIIQGTHFPKLTNNEPVLPPGHLME